MYTYSNKTSVLKNTEKNMFYYFLCEVTVKYSLYIVTILLRGALSAGYLNYNRQFHLFLSHRKTEREREGKRRRKRRRKKRQRKKSRNRLIGKRK